MWRISLVNHLRFDMRKMITVRLRSVVTKRGPENGRSWFHKSKLKAFATWRFYITLCCFGISRGEIQEEEEEDGFDDGGHGGVASWKHDLHALTSATSAKNLGSQKGEGVGWSQYLNKLWCHLWTVPNILNHCVEQTLGGIGSSVLNCWTTNPLNSPVRP